MCWTSRLKIHHFVFSHSHVAVNDDSPGGKTQIRISSGLGDDIFPVILIASVFFRKKRCSLSECCIHRLPVKKFSLLLRLHIKSTELVNRMLTPILKLRPQERHCAQYAGHSLAIVHQNVSAEQNNSHFHHFLTLDPSCSKYVSGSNGYRRSCLKELQVTGCNFTVRLPTPFPSIRLSGSLLALGLNSKYFMRVWPVQRHHLVGRRHAISDKWCCREQTPPVCN